MRLNCVTIESCRWSGAKKLWNKDNLEKHTSGFNSFRKINVRCSPEVWFTGTAPTDLRLHYACSCSLLVTPGCCNIRGRRRLGTTKVISGVDSDVGKIISHSYQHRVAWTRSLRENTLSSRSIQTLLINLSSYPRQDLSKGDLHRRFNITTWKKLLKQIRCFNRSASIAYTCCKWSADSQDVVP